MLTIAIWAAAILIGAYFVFAGTAALGTRNRPGGVEIVVPSMVFAILAASAWVVATSILAIIVSTLT